MSPDHLCVPQVKCLAVPGRELAAAARRVVPPAASKWIDLAIARVLFEGLVPVPASMPPEGDDSAEDDDDDDDGGEAAEPEPAIGRQYALKEADFNGAVTAHLEVRREPRWAATGAPD